MSLERFRLDLIALVLFDSLFLTMAVEFKILFVILLGFVISSQAYDFYVGGRDGWVLKPSESYGSWASRNRFQVNDTLVFKYKSGSDSVLLVNQQQFDACNGSSPLLKMDDGDSKYKLERSGPFYFISGNQTSCQSGQKLVLVVMSPRHWSPPSVPSTPPSATPASSPPGSAPSPDGAETPSTPPSATPGSSPPASAPGLSPPGSAPSPDGAERPGSSPPGSAPGSSPSGSAPSPYGAETPSSPPVSAPGSSPPGSAPGSSPPGSAPSPDSAETPSSPLSPPGSAPSPDNAETPSSLPGSAPGSSPPTAAPGSSLPGSPPSPDGAETPNGGNNTQSPGGNNQASAPSSAPALTSSMGVALGFSLLVTMILSSF